MRMALSMVQTAHNAVIPSEARNPSKIYGQKKAGCPRRAAHSE